MKAELSGSLAKQIKSRIERYEFEVGTLEDHEHFEPKENPISGPPDLGSYAGGPVRKQSRVSSGKTDGQILVENMERLNVNLLAEPFKKKDSDLMKFTTAFLRMATGGKIALKRVENLLQAVVRNPILREEYGKNKGATADGKGFDRHLFDTGQMFKSIKARAKRV